MRLDEHAAWAAGFLDGEGYFAFIATSGARGQLKIQVSQIDRRPLDRLADLLGGKVHGPYEVKPGNDNCRPQYSWALTSIGDWCRAIGLLWPYLCEPKQEQIAAAFGRAAFQWAARPSKNPRGGGWNRRSREMAA